MDQKKAREIKAFIKLTAVEKKLLPYFFSLNIHQSSFEIWIEMPELKIGMPEYFLRNH